MYVSIEDDSINDSLSGSEVECKDKEYKEDTSSSKGKQECHVMTVGHSMHQEDPIARLKL